MKPILFNSTMINAILNGTKTQTRRIIKPQPKEVYQTPGRPDWGWHTHPKGGTRIFCPYKIGGVLGIRETVRTLVWQNHREPFCYGEFLVEYVADGKLIACPPALEKWWRHNWRKRPSQKIPSIHMPNSLIRLKPPITNIRVERVQDINFENCVAEGVTIPASDNGILLRVTGKYPPCDYWPKGTVTNKGIQDENAVVIAHFASLWDSINAKPQPSMHNPYTNKPELCKVGYPWDDVREETTITTKASKFHNCKVYIVGNPGLWALAFKRTEKPK